MEIDVTTEKKLVASTEDMQDVRIHSEAGLQTASEKGLFEKGRVAEAIAGICAKVWSYLQEQFEDPWTGTVRILVVSDPKSSSFQMDTYYDVITFPDFTKSDLEDMFDGALQILDELEEFQDFFFSLDFRVRKKPCM